MGKNSDSCKNCPYIEDELQEIIADYQESLKYGCELYQYITCQYIIERQYLHCFCKKLDSRLIACKGRCENPCCNTKQKANRRKSKKYSKKGNAYWNTQNRYANNPRFHFKKKRGYKRSQCLRIQKQMQRLWRIVQYPYPVIYVDTIKKNGEFCDREVPYYRREWENHGGIGRRFCKKMSNRRVRYYKGGISKGGNYRKIYDYQWAIS